MRRSSVESDGSNMATPPRAAAGWAWAYAWAEIICITALFAAAGAWAVPDVNEAHYLTKARHFSNPTWVAGDFFLETSEAHGVFYQFLGPLAVALTLEQAAWVGRWLGWLALACGFRHAAQPLLAAGAARLLAAAIFSLALRHTTAAGEWLIGGCEAKVFSWAMVLAAAGEIAWGRLAVAWVALAAATAAHPIVGGWGMGAMVLERCLTARTTLWQNTSPWNMRTGFLVVAGVLVAGVGIVPALSLTSGVEPDVRVAATHIYVVERLSHHLLVRTFADGFIARHVLAILLWAAVLRLSPSSPARQRAAGFTIAAIVLSAIGCGISLLEPVAPDMTYGLLRFYWFRLADGLVPLSLSLAVASLVWGGLWQFWQRIGMAAMICFLGADLFHESRHWPLPWRHTLVARSDSKMQAAAWQDICEWVRDNTPADACFLTPRGASTFTWRTGRREVVAWKNMPQDPKSLVEWRARIVDCFSHDGTLNALERSTVSLGLQRMQLVAQRYGANYAVVPADRVGPAPLDGSQPPLPWPLLYANAGYAVYHMTEIMPAEPRTDQPP